MFLEVKARYVNKKIEASSLAEVVIAIAVIALCIGVASLVFVRSTKVTVNFQEVRMQTEIQSMLWKQLYTSDGDVQEMEDLVLEIEEEEDSLVIYTFKGLDDKLIWKQQWVKSE